VNLTQADLIETNLYAADLQDVTGLPSQIRSARNWGKAFYGPEMLRSLGLPPDHNDRLKKVLDEEHTEK